MIPAIREALRTAASQALKYDNPGLAYDRYLKMAGKESETGAMHQLQGVLVASPAPEAYRVAFERWRKLAEANGCLMIAMELTAPLAIGLGNESGAEIGITTNRTYGMPVIPGSAVKGLCHRTARLEEPLPDIAMQTLFGAPEVAAACIWHDAWYMPSSVGGRPFQADTITVHHPLYYQSHGADEWPTDFDDPTPVAFVSVRPGARFLFSVKVRAEADVASGWQALARDYLVWCLGRTGIGGKTNAGYGRFRALEAPSGTKTDTEEWPGAHLSYNKGNGEATCTTGAGTARAKLVDIQLPDDLRERCKKKGSLPGVDVTVSKQGNMLVIKSIKPAG
jgi:CRISPR-associated protein Cmr6